jgi:uncharacterized protein (TIGR03067 family)
MKRYSVTALLLGWLMVAFGQAGAGDPDKEEAIKKDRESYQGRWTVIALEVNGTRVSDKDARQITVVNRKDGTWTIRVEGNVIARGTSRIDPLQKPKAYDFTPSEGMDKGKTYLGIYEIRGGYRKLCYAPPGKDRPHEFAARPKSGHVFVVFQREKD